MSSKPVELHQAIVSATVRWLSLKWYDFSVNALDRPLKVAVVDTPNAIRSFRRATGDDALSYPFGLMTLVRLSLDTERGGFNKRFNNIGLSKDSRDVTAMVRSLTPVKMGLGLSLRTDRLDEVMAFSSMIFNHAPGPVLVIKDNYSFQYESRLFFDTDIDITEPESSEDGKKFVINFVISANSWDGVITNTPLIRNMQVSFNEGISGHRYSARYDVDNGNTMVLSEFTREDRDMFDQDSNYYRGNNRGNP